MKNSEIVILAVEKNMMKLGWHHIKILLLNMKKGKQ